MSLIVKPLGRKLKPGNIFSIGSAHIIAGFSLWYAFSSGFSAWNWIFAVILFVLCCFGVTLGYHRMLTHRGFRCGRLLRVILSICGGMAAQGPEYEWVANHRVHHYFADQKLDPHSPRAYPGLKGFLWGHVLWLFFWYERPAQYRTFSDLDKDPVVRWQKRFYLPIVLLGLALPYAAFGWKGVLLCGFLRMVFSWHVSWSVNSICHLIGSRARDSAGQIYTGDDSRNNIIVALLSLGEGYHANHHVRPAWAYHGWNRYSLDASKWLLQLLELLGLISDVKKPAPEFYFHQSASEKSA